MLDGSGNPLSGSGGDCRGGDSPHSVFAGDGTVLAAGQNNRGQLGDGTCDRTTPVRVLQSIGGAVSNIVKFASGHSHNILLKGDGSVWGVGYNDRGNLETCPIRIGPTQLRFWTQQVSHCLQ